VLPDCANCKPYGFVFPLPENIKALQIIDLYINFMFRENGIPNIKAITEILLLEGYAGDRVMLEKLMLYTLVATNERNRRRQPVRTIKRKK